MNVSTNEHDWETRLQISLGVAPEPNFDQWCERHPDAVAVLSSPVTTLPPKAMSWTNGRTLWKIAASIMLVTGAVLIFSGNENLGPNAFAQGIPGIDNVPGMTWTEIFFERVTSADKKRTWIEQTRVKNEYLHPGKYRKTIFDQDGKPENIFITDLQANRELVLKPKENTAVLQVPSRGMEDKRIRGPFAWVGDEIRMTKVDGGTAVVSVSLAGQRKLGDQDVNIVRVKSAIGGQKHTVDYLFDQETKQLVSFASGNPGSGFHPDTSIGELKTPSEQKWSNREAVGLRTHDIIVDAKIDPSLFSLDKPVGYELDTIAEPTVTEADLLAFLGASARFNDNTFPDSAFEPFNVDKFNEESEKSREARSEVAKALFEIRDKIAIRGIYQTPALRFVEDQAKPNSFHYVGADVRVGDSERIVLWYQPKSGNTYRAFYGDLSFKDVTKADLPLVLSE